MITRGDAPRAAFIWRCRLRDVEPHRIAGIDRHEALAVRAAPRSPAHGPMAEGFFAAFGLGDNPGGLATGDVQGVALAAIQGLNAKLAAKERELAEVKATLALLAEQVERLARVTPADPSVAQSRRD